MDFFHHKLFWRDLFHFHNHVTNQAVSGEKTISIKKFIFSPDKNNARVTTLTPIHLTIFFNMIISIQWPSEISKEVTS